MRLTSIIAFAAVCVSSDALPASSSPIHEAAARGDTTALATLIAADSSLMAYPDSIGMTPLHSAAYHGQNAAATLLLDLGAPVDAVRANGSTPLHGAAFYGHPDMVLLLLEHGATADIENQFGFTPLRSALEAGQAEIARALLERGADPFFTSQDGTTILHSVAQAGQVDLARLLLDKGLDPSAVTADGATPLMLASLRGHADIVRMLVAAGALVDTPGPSSRSPLHAAAAQGHADLVRVLLECGAAANPRDDRGYTPLAAAVRHGHTTTVEALLERDVDSDAAESHFGFAPLHWASAEGNPTLLSALVGHGCNVSLADKDGFTPLDLARRYGQTDAARFLENHGASSQMNTPLSNPIIQLSSLLADGSAHLWYLGHCGWGIKTRNHFMVFDYTRMGRTPGEPTLSGGTIDPAQIKGLPVTVFVTHGHADHFDSTIAEWASEVPRIRYVFGFSPEDLPEYQARGYSGPAYEHMVPHQARKLDGLQITTIEANDAGVGFLVEVDGLRIYHAGDHAGWREGERDGFTGEIDYLAGRTEQLDLAFLNVTGCHVQDRTALRQSIDYTIASLHPVAVVPTHGLFNEQAYREFAVDLARRGIPTRVYCPTLPGDHFSYQRKAS